MMYYVIGGSIVLGIGIAIAFFYFRYKQSTDETGTARSTERSTERSTTKQDDEDKIVPETEEERYERERNEILFGGESSITGNIHIHSTPTPTPAPTPTPTPTPT